MKSLFLFVLIFFSLKLHAQHLNGIVADGFTHLPISNAIVSTPSSVTTTDAMGRFSLPGGRISDTLKISCMGYKIYRQVITQLTPDTILLQQQSILLKNVTVFGQRNYKNDSLRLRKDYAPVFAYKAPTIKDVFITHSPYAYVPNNYITSPNNTTAIISVNLLSVISVLSKNKAPETKMQKILLKQEEDNYADHVFSRSRVSGITALKGDSLRDFIAQYRLPVREVKKMNDYEINVYIKKSYQEFIKTYKQQNQAGLELKQ